MLINLKLLLKFHNNSRALFHIHKIPALKTSANTMDHKVEYDIHIYEFL